MKPQLNIHVLAGALIPILTPVVDAALSLGSPFTDHMVLQRDQAVPVWGWADPGARVEVRFGDEMKKSVAGDDGAWRVDLGKRPGSYEASELKVEVSTGESITLSDVVVGEVWICAGQSNMQMGVGAVPEVKALVPLAKHIRSFHVQRMVAFQEQSTCEGTWKIAVPDSAVALAFAHSLQSMADVPVGIILSSWGSSSLEAWMPRGLTETVPHFKTMMEEFDADEVTRKRIEAALDGPEPWGRKEDIFLRRQPNILYNAMMKPLIPYGCRGLVWYQGERNAQSMHGMVKAPWFSRNSGMLRYGGVMKQWIHRYRADWGRKDMQFLVVMLPRYGAALASGPDRDPASPRAHSWAWMRQAQLETKELPHVGVANTIDLGDVKNVHPKDKLPVGQRLALLAARDTLGQDRIAEGPEMSGVESRGDTLVVQFKYAKGLKTKDEKSPQGFWLGSESGEWVPAVAKIEGATVLLRSPKLKEPRYIRYAFAGFPEVNLVNGTGLPAYPFRTDRFEP